MASNTAQLLQVLQQLYTSNSAQQDIVQRKQLEAWLQQQFNGPTKWQYAVQFLNAQQPELLQWFGLQLLEQQLADKSWQSIDPNNRDNIKKFLFDRCKVIQGSCLLLTIGYLIAHCFKTCEC